MGNDYFENRTRHLLPLANKTLVQHLIETVDKCTQIGRKHIIIEEKVEENEKKKPCEESYKAIFRERIGDDVVLVGEDPLTQAGTFEAVRRYIDQDNDTKEDMFPLLVLYGDTLVEEKFLRRIVDQYYDEQEPSKIVWGLVESKKEIEKFVITKPRRDKNNDFGEIKGADILNILEYPILRIRKDGPYDFLHDTGIMMISKEAWKDIHKLIQRIHRPSSLGFFSFANILKQALVFKDINIEEIGDMNIKIIGIAASASEYHWNEANYPWEILALNKIKILDSVKDAAWTGEEEKEIGQKTTFVPEKVEFTMPNGARIKGPCVLGKNVEIKDYAVIEKSYIGEGCNIGSHAVIRDSTLVKDIKIHYDAVIENAIIMENSVICYHAEVIHSIVGKEVMIGSDVKTPCQRLKNVEGFLFSTDIKLKEDFNKGILSEVLKDAFKTYGFSLSANAGITKGEGKENEWVISDEKMRKFFARKEDGKLNISVDGKPVYQWVIYFSDIGIKKTEKFGAIIGDYCQIGSGTVIHPGRRIGKRSKIYANCEILKNVKPSSKLRNKDIIEGYD